MPNPSSSATSPSPPAHPSQSPTISSHSHAADDADQRKRAVDKFLARAEIAMVTRALRARLSYANYKATHNIPHVPLRDLEAQALPHSQPTTAFSRSQAAKRKAVATPGTPRRGAMPPPSPRTSYATYQDTRTTPVPSSSSLYASLLAPTPPPTHTARTVHNPSDPPVPAPVRQVTSPAPRVRVVKASPRHGKGKASVPPSPAQQRKAAGKGKRRQHEDTSSIASGSRYADGDIDMDSVDDADPDMKAAATLTSLLMHHHRPSMSAVGSPRGSVASPRASIDTGHIQHGPTHSGQFAQSAARGESHIASPAFGPSTAGNATHDQSRALTPPPRAYQAQNASPRTHTHAASTSSLAPTHTANNSTSSATGRPLTPGGSISSGTAPAASDSEAANLMLFLATSPSPVRPSSSKDSRDAAAYRVLGGSSGSSAPGGLVAKGRVLFTGNSEGPPIVRGRRVDVPQHPPLGAGLRRGEGSANFSFGVSSLSPSMEGGASGSAAGPAASGNTPAANGGLLPPPALPGKSTLPAPGSPLRASALPRRGVTTRLTSVPVPGSHVLNTPGGPFDFSDFLNSSPLPPPPDQPSQSGDEAPLERPGPINAATVAAYNASLNSEPALQSQSQLQASSSSHSATSNSSVPSSPKSVSGNNGRNHGLRADVGRKLFEEEQMRFREREKEKVMHNGAGARVETTMDMVEPTPPKDVAETARVSVPPPSTLGAGIEL